MRITCKNCGGDHPVWDCKRPAKKSMGRAGMQKRTAARVAQVADAGIDLGNGTLRGMASEPVGGVATSPVDTNSQAVESGVSAFGPHGVITSSAGTEGEVDRQLNTNAGSPNGRVTGFEPVGAGSTPAPASKFDKKAWQREYMRPYMQKRRAAAKEAK